MLLGAGEGDARPDRAREAGGCAQHGRAGLIDEQHTAARAITLAQVFNHLAVPHKHHRTAQAKQVCQHAPEHCQPFALGLYWQDELGAYGDRQHERDRCQCKVPNDEPRWARSFKGKGDPYIERDPDCQSQQSAESRPTEDAFSVHAAPIVSQRAGKANSVSSAPAREAPWFASRLELARRSRAS